MSLAPTRPASGCSRNTARIASSQPGVTIVSLLRKTMISPRASSAPRLLVPMNPRFAGLRTNCTPVTALQLLGHRLGRRIVDDDHLVGPGGRMRLHAVEAGERQQRLAVDGDHDRDLRRLAAREGQGPDVVLEAEHRRARRLEPALAVDLGPRAREHRLRSLVAEDGPGHRHELRRPAHDRPARARFGQQRPWRDGRRGGSGASRATSSTTRARRCAAVRRRATSRHGPCGSASSAACAARTRAAPQAARDPPARDRGPREIPPAAGRRPSTRRFNSRRASVWPQSTPAE